MPGWIDHLFVALVLVAAPIDGARERRRLQRELDAGNVNARLEAYARVMVWQWSGAAVLILFWVLSRRSFRMLGVQAPDGMGFVVASILVIAITVGLANQARMARGSAEFAARVREAAASLSFMTPSTPAESSRFTWLGLTAGVVEELIFRGYLVWYFASFAPLWAAIVITAIAFGIGHLYQGVAGVLKTTAVGLFFGVLYWLSGSIWAPMFLHAATDVLQGRLIYFSLTNHAAAAAQPIAER